MMNFKSELLRLDPLGRPRSNNNASAEAIFVIFFQLHICRYQFLNVLKQNTRLHAIVPVLVFYSCIGLYKSFFNSFFTLTQI